MFLGTRLISTQHGINIIRKSPVNRITKFQVGYSQVTDHITLSLFFLLPILPWCMLYPMAFFI